MTTQHSHDTRPDRDPSSRLRDDEIGRLLRAAADVRDATPADHVGSVPPRWVARPSDTAGVAALMRVAHEHGLAVVARGAGTKQDWAAPPRALDLVIETTGLAEVIEYAPDDLVLRVGAGVRLETIEDLLAENGQRLGIDPARRGTIGGAVATAATGPMRLTHGSVRDLVLGVTFVRADGTIAKAGGKVVKNVAGYDLGKLLTGAFGTLGIITELSFRLHPRAEATRWIGAPLDTAGLSRVLDAIAQEQIVPSAVEIDVPVDGRSSLSVQFDGTLAGMGRRVDRMRELLVEAGQVSDAGIAVDDGPPFWWGAEPPGEAMLKVTHVVGRAGALAESLREAAEATGVRCALRGSALVGVAHVGLDAPGPESFARFVEMGRAATAALEGTLVVLRAPAPWRDAVDPWGPVAGLPLMRAVKDQFDPDAILAPGRFVGGI